MTAIDSIEGVLPQEKRTPSERWMWFFILGDMSIFALFFGAYLWSLGTNREAFMGEAASLVLALGLINTLLLLSSSYTVARAVHAYREDNFALTRTMLGWSLTAAAAFVGIKVIEYGMGLADGHGLTTSPFFMYYFVLTGLHLLHVVIGSIFLIDWRLSLRNISPGNDRHSHSWAESVAGYWHMVDLLWLLIFAFVYIGSSS
jgi:nitric oxide reductase NorE protein